MGFLQGLLLVTWSLQLIIASPLNADPSSGRVRRAAIVDLDKKWPSGIVPYELDLSFTDPQKELIKTSLDEVTERVGCVTFVKKTSQTSYVNVTKIEINSGSDQDGCWSFVGKQESQPQVMNLASTCMKKHFIQREFIRALGVHYQQKRPDRDTYVNIHWDNIGTNCKNNFEKMDEGEMETYGFPYDIHSITHYPSTACRKDGSSSTITSKTEPFEIPVNKEMTNSDIQILKKLYCGTCSEVCDPVKHRICIKANDGTSTCQCMSSFREEDDECVHDSCNQCQGENTQCNPDTGECGCVENYVMIGGSCQYIS